VGASRNLIGAAALSALLLTNACGSGTPPAPPAPSPVADPPTANVYILPGAVDLGPDAFGDHPLVIYMGERMRWRNFDAMEHTIVADMATLPEFAATGPLAPGAERSFIMNTLGRTTIHCTTHPQMTGTMVVQER
jgi:plastocyanin